MEELILTGNILNSDIPNRITDEFNNVPTSLSQILTRLDEGGKLTLENATLEFGEIDPYDASKLFLGIKELELKNSTIITNGNFLEVYCEKLLMDTTSKIISFKNENSKADIEIKGDYGGNVHLYITDRVGKLNINLDGQNGGNGKDGVKGNTGAQGPRGRGGRNGSFGTCLRGSGRGGNGQRGGNGSNGSDGANAGDGGVLKIFFLEKDIQTDLEIEFKSNNGIGGIGGNGGLGGDGGTGGLGGKVAGNCHNSSPERNRGSQGAQGINGIQGNSGVNGIDGKSFIEKINIEDIINSLQQRI
jgi:hypothetical protein